MRLIIVEHQGNTTFLRPVCSGERNIKDNYKVQVPPENVCGPQMGHCKEVHGNYVCEEELYLRTLSE
jgi:hypothetical protein